jgi:vacuolar protein sorting-associated protein 33A
MPSTMKTESSTTILPSASALNPIPALSSALRIDNQDQLMDFLFSSSDDYDSSVDLATIDARKGSNVATSTGSTTTLNHNTKQLFVFGTSSLRTLFMRQVLSNPDVVAAKVLQSKGNTSNKKKNNWDGVLSFPDIPKELNLVGTRVLKISGDSPATSEILIPNATTIETESRWKEDGLDQMDIDVITYFLRPNDLEQTQLAMIHFNVWTERMNKSNRKRRQLHHRFLYIPELTALVQKIHEDIGLTASSSPGTIISIHSLQLDLFPLETDVISLEYENAFRDDVIEETPSFLISTCARSIQKLQDIVGPIQRIQSYGPMAEEILIKLLNNTVDEFLEQEPDDVSYDNEKLSFVEGGAVAAMILMDRKVDLITPLVTTLTYEGLLDHIFGIDSGYIVADLNTINPDSNPDDTSSVTSSGSKQSVSATTTSAGTSTTHPPKSSLVALGVNGSDSLYAEVRNHHVEKFGSFLQNQARALQQSHANFTDKNKKKELSEIHQFVKQMPMFTQNLRSLTNHIHLAELIKRTSEEVTFREHWQLERTILEGEICYEQIEDLIAMQYTPYNLFRLLCLQSLCCGGIKSSKYDTIKRDIVQAYGYESMFLLTNLEKSGLLRRRDGLWGTIQIDTSSMSSSSYNNVLRKSLILINAEVDTTEPDDISYVSSGYAPISIRIVQTATIKGWIGRQDILRELPGKHYDIMQVVPPQDLTTLMNNKKIQIRKGSLASHVEKTTNGGTTATTIESSPITTTANITTKKPILILFFIGGVTYMEIAALRFLSKRTTFPYHIVCITTKVINGFTMLQSLQ